MSENIQERLYNKLKTRFEGLSDEGDKGYQRLDEVADARIVRWRYAEQSAFELQDDFFRRFNTKPGELVDEEPISAMHYYAYGYDAQNRIVYAAQFHFEELPFISTFYEHGDGFIEAAEYRREHYREDYRLSEVSRFVMQQPDAKPAHHARYSTGGIRTAYSVESYHYDDAGRLSRIASASRYDPQPFNDEAQRLWQHGIDQQRQMAKWFGTEEQTEQFIASLQNAVNVTPDESSEEEIYEYEGDILKRIVSHHTSVTPDNETQTYDRIAYEIRNPDETDEALFEAARVSMRTQIIKSVMAFSQQDRLQRRIYNLSVSYDAVADDGFLLTLGMEDRRQVWEEITDSFTYMSLYYFDLEPHRDVWDLPRDYQRFLDIYRYDQRWDEIRDLHIRVARDLNDYDWTGILNTTDDFIVFAHDHERLEDIHDCIRACVPEAKVRILEEKGLLD